MSEKKFVFTGLRAVYNGPVDIEEFFADVEKWLQNNGYEKEPKKYSEHLKEGIKQIEWVIEAHKSFDRWYRGTIIVKVLFDKVKSSTIKIQNRKTRITSSDVLVQLDGLIESEISGSFYHRRPLYQFIILFIDKYIYNFWSDKYDGRVVGDGNTLFKQIKSFFSLQKYRFQHIT